MRPLYNRALRVLCVVFMYLAAVDELDGSLPEEEIDMVFEVDRPHKMRSCKEKAPALPNWRKSPTSHQISQREAEMKKDNNLGHSWRRGRPRAARSLSGMPKISCRSSPFYRATLARPLTVEVLKIVLLRPDPVPDDESVRTGEVGHSSRIKLAT